MIRRDQQRSNAIEAAVLLMAFVGTARFAINCNQSPPLLKRCKSLPVYRLATSAAATACDDPDVRQYATRPVEPAPRP